MDNVDLFQLSLLDEQNTIDSSYSSIFKKLYYYLYSNSDVSRAERIIEDLAKILLCRLAKIQNVFKAKFDDYIDGIGFANEDILPLLVTTFPNYINLNDTFSLDDSAIRKAFAVLSEIDLNIAPAHIIGDAFQALIGPRLRGDKGQFFTPKSLVNAMVQIVKVNSGDKVVDPACGTGGFLSEAYNQCQNIKLVGMDKDRDLWRLASALLEISTKGSSILHNLNSLDIKNLRQISVENTPFDADIILTNPPFGAKIGITDKSILSQFELGHYWLFSKSENNWILQDKLRKSQDPQILFIELCVRLLKPSGKLAIVLPEGIFGNWGSGYIWTYLLKHGRIIALLDCPRTTFQPSTDTKTNVLFYQKNPENIVYPKEKVWIGVAIHSGHDRRGRITNSNGSLHPDDFKILAQEYTNNTLTPTKWSQCELTPNNFYFVPRYYDQSIDFELNELLRIHDGKIVSLQELINKNYIKITKGHEIGSEAYDTGEIPFVRTSDISNFEINPNPDKGISEEIYNIYSSYQNLSSGDILLVVDGRYRIGRSAILTEHNAKCVIQSHIRIIKVHPHAPFSSYELLYILNMKQILHQMRNLVYVQSTLGSLGKRLLQLKIILPKQNEYWLAKINHFKENIQNRSRLLAELKSVGCVDIEL